MDTGEALSIIYDLALENALDPANCESYEINECDRQKQAFDIVHDFIVNNFGED